MTTFADLETSVCAGAPWEAYWFSCGAKNWRYTSGDKDRTIAGLTYGREAIERTEVSQNEELNSGSIAVTLPPDNAVAQLFLPGYLPPDKVNLIVYRGHEGVDDQVVHFIGVVSSNNYAEDKMVLTAVPERDAFKRQVPGGEVLTACPRTLFGKGCRLEKAAWEVSITLDGVAGTTLSSEAFGDYEDGYFKGGFIETAETKMSIIAHSKSARTVKIFYPLDLAAGDTVIVIPGCDGSESCCRDRFNNIANHLGFSRIPKLNVFKSGVS